MGCSQRWELGLAAPNLGPGTAEECSLAVGEVGGTSLAERVTLGLKIENTRSATGFKILRWDDRAWDAHLMMAGVGVVLAGKSQEAVGECRSPAVGREMRVLEVESISVSVCLQNFG